MKTPMVALALVSAVSALATPHVSNVSMTQESSTRRVTISYQLDEPAIVTFDVQTNRGDGAFVSIGRAPVQNLAGEFNKLVTTVGKPINLYWQPDVQWGLGVKFPEGSVKAVVTAWATNAPPDYMVFDLNGVDCVRYYESEAELPYPITNDLMKTDYLVMKKVHATDVTWRMGSLATETGRASNHTEDPHMVTLTKDYYLAVYELTVGQYHKIIGAKYGSVDARRPAWGLTYDALRGSVSENINWPDTNHAVSDTSLLKTIRGSLGVEADLPTEAQWEYACRAGTTAACYNGAQDATAANVGELGWCSENIADSPTGSGQATYVGLKECNAWGFYDMYGNMGEWTLDWINANYSLKDYPCIDPVGMPTDKGAHRSMRGGRYSASCSYYFRSALVDRFASTQNANYCGLRLCAPAAASTK